MKKKYVYLYNRYPVYGSKTKRDWLISPKATLTVEASNQREAHQKCAFHFGMGKRPWYCFLVKVL